MRIHKGEYYDLVHVIIGRNNVNGELWAIVSDEKTTLQTFSEYGLRFDIETHGSPNAFGLSAVACLQENFLDDQSGGWLSTALTDTKGWKPNEAIGGAKPKDTFEE